MDNTTQRVLVIDPSLTVKLGPTEDGQATVVLRELRSPPKGFSTCGNTLLHSRDVHPVDCNGCDGMIWGAATPFPVAQILGFCPSGLICLLVMPGWLSIKLCKVALLIPRASFSTGLACPETECENSCAAREEQLLS